MKLARLVYPFLWDAPIPRRASDAVGVGWTFVFYWAVSFMDVLNLDGCDVHDTTGENSEFLN